MLKERDWDWRLNLAQHLCVSFGTGFGHNITLWTGFYRLHWSRSQFLSERLKEEAGLSVNTTRDVQKETSDKAAWTGAGLASTLSSLNPPKHFIKNKYMKSERMIRYKAGSEAEGCYMSSGALLLFRPTQVVRAGAKPGLVCGSWRWPSPH